MHKIEELLDWVKTGKVRIDDLDWKSFQRLTFYAICKEFQLDVNDEDVEYCDENIDIKNYNKGPIDIIISRPTSTTPFIQKPTYEKYFIECKQHRRDLEFDTVAKVMCVALRYNPKALLIVSSSNLSKQALEYIDYFFRTEDTPDDNNLGTQGKHIFFRRYDLQAALLGSENTLLKEEAKIKEWELIESNIFNEQIIASSEESNSTVLINSNFFYSLRLWLYISPLLLEDKNISFSVIDSKNKIYSELKQKKFDYLKSGEVFIEFSISTSFNKHLLDGATLLSIKADQLQDNIGLSLHLPLLKQYRKINLLDGARREETISNAEIFNRNDKSLLFVTGEGGVGKTVYCNTITKELIKKNIYKPHQITITEQTTEELFFQLLWRLIAPQRVEKNNFTQSEVLIFKEYLKSFLPANTSDENDALIDKVASLRVQDVSLDRVIYLCARALSISKIAQLIVVRDCHKLSPKLSKGIETLITQLNDEGWGKTKLIFEYRETSKESLNHWERLVCDIQSAYSQKLVRVKICPLSKNELIELLEKKVSGSDASLLVEILMKKTAGNPFFIDHLLNFFQAQGYIKHSHVSKDKITITDFVELQREASILPNEVSSFLKKSFNSFLTREENKQYQSLLVSYLGLASVIGMDINESLIARALKTTDAELCIARNILIRDNFIKPNLSKDYPATFVHEIMQCAMLECTRHYAFFFSAGRSLLCILNKENIHELIIGGKVGDLINDSDTAYDLFQKGHELAKYKSLFSFQSICLYGLRNILLKMRLDEDKQRKLVNVSCELGWTELQIGAQHSALLILRETLQTINESKVETDDQRRENSITVNSINSQILTIYVRTLSPSPFFEFSQNIINKITSIEQLDHLLSRFILICATSNMPNLGVRAATLSWQINYDKPDKFCFSDTGRLYLVNNPTITNFLWKKAYKIDIENDDLRQINHSKINMLVVKLIADSKFEDSSIVAAIRESLDEQKVVNLQIRLKTFIGIHAFNQGNIEEAKYHFSQALDQANDNSQTLWQVVNHNNLSLLYLIEKDYTKVINHLEKAIDLTWELINCSLNNKQASVHVLDLFVRKAEELTYEKKLSSIIPEPWGLMQPEISGTFLYLIHNISSLIKELNWQNERVTSIVNHFSEIKALPILKKKKHPMIFSYRKIRLIFALE